MIRVILVTVVLFCTSVGTASGEGRWLLWRGGREIASFDAESECRAEALLKARATAVEEAGKPPSHEGAGEVELHGTSIHIPEHFETRVIRFECRPDYRTWKAPNRR